jgi:hypothetical protein
MTEDIIYTQLRQECKGNIPFLEQFECIDVDVGNGFEEA